MRVLVDALVGILHARLGQQRDRPLLGVALLGVVGLGESLQEALDVSYARVNGITFDGMQFRKDIGQKAFKHLK